MLGIKSLRYIVVVTTIAFGFTALAQDKTVNDGVFTEAQVSAVKWFTMHNARLAITCVFIEILCDRGTINHCCIYGSQSWGPCLRITRVLDV